MSRLSATELIKLAESMPERERELVETTGRLRLVAGKQLERLFFHNGAKAASRARAARRVLASLTEQGVLFRLERRIGGVRAGSAGHVYGLGPVGKRLIAYWRGEGLRRVRTPYEPGVVYVRHSLAVAEQYVRLREAERGASLELLWFEAEPECWRSFAGAAGAEVLKPDALVKVGVGEFIETSFLEVDCGTEGRGALFAKCRRYVRYFDSGVEQAESGVFPRVVWITTSQARVRLLVEVCAEMGAEHWRLFVVGTTGRAVPLLRGDVTRGDAVESTTKCPQTGQAGV
jgi:hypothetical protein